MARIKKHRQNNNPILCSNTWAKDKSIINELGLLIIISGLTASTGVCDADNSYFAKELQFSKSTISKRLNKLNKLGYIIIIGKTSAREIMINWEK